MLLENRHHDVILDFDGGDDERWKVYPLLSWSEFNYQRIGTYVNSCNGLLFFFDKNDGEAYICNPTSNESRVIPLPQSVEFTPPGFSCMWLCSSLGFDSRSNDYKFIISANHISDDGDSLTSYVELYSLKTDSWKTLTGFPSRAFRFSEPCVYADGSIYWLSFVSIDSDSPYYTIDSFDFSDETHSSFDVSPLVQPCSNHVRLVLIGSQLGLVSYKTNSPYCFELWVKTAGGWNINKLLDFSLPQILDPGHRYPTHDIIILGFSGELILYLAAANGEVFAYDCAANQLEKLQIRLRKYRDPVFISYVETTVSPTRIS